MTRATRSVLVLGGRPLVVVDVDGEGRTDPLSRPGDPVVWSFVDAGLRLLPGFLGQALPVCPGLLLDLDEGAAFRTADAGEVALLVPSDELADEWRAACLHHGGCLLVIGRDVGLPVDGTAAEIGARLDEVSRAARLVGGVVDTPDGSGDALPLVVDTRGDGDPPDAS